MISAKGCDMGARSLDGWKPRLLRKAHVKQLQRNANICTNAPEDIDRMHKAALMMTILLPAGDHSMQYPNLSTRKPLKRTNTRNSSGKLASRSRLEEMNSERIGSTMVLSLRITVSIRFKMVKWYSQMLKRAQLAQKSFQ